jgi:putative IMPACT (imprinted ancient) family translation regulator
MLGMENWTHVRFNDDGEPSAQQVVLFLTIEGNDLTNIIVLVNRWYGGVKLGTGGLVRRMVDVQVSVYCSLKN